MARTAGRRRLAGRAAAQDFGYGRRARLDSRCAGGLGSAMAAPMIPPAHAPAFLAAHGWGDAQILPLAGDASFRRYFRVVDGERRAARSEEHTSELQSLMRISYAAFCFRKNNSELYLHQPHLLFI